MCIRNRRGRPRPLRTLGQRGQTGHPELSTFCTSKMCGMPPGVGPQPVGSRNRAGRALAIVPGSVTNNCCNVYCVVTTA